MSGVRPNQRSCGCPTHFLYSPPFPSQGLDSSQVLLRGMSPRNAPYEPVANRQACAVSDIGVVKFRLLNAKKSKIRCSLREKPSPPLRWKQAKKQQQKTLKIMHEVFLLGRTSCSLRLQSPCCRPEQLSQAVELGPRQPVLLRPNIVANKVICFSWCLPKHLG